MAAYKEKPEEEIGEPRKRRDRLQIIAEILAVTKNGAMKTKIMYKASLSFAQLNEYLNYLLDIGFLETVESGKKEIYKRTHKGVKYLRSYAEIQVLIAKPKSPDKPEEHLFSQ